MLTFLVLRLLVFHNTRIQETAHKRINDSLEICLILRKSVFVALCIQLQLPFVLETNDSISISRCMFETVIITDAELEVLLTYVLQTGSKPISTCNIKINETALRKKMNSI